MFSRCQPYNQHEAVLNDLFRNHFVPLPDEEHRRGEQWTSEPGRRPAFPCPVSPAARESERWTLDRASVQSQSDELICLRPHLTSQHYTKTQTKQNGKNQTSLLQIISSCTRLGFNDVKLLLNLFSTQNKKFFSTSSRMHSLESLLEITLIPQL